MSDFPRCQIGSGPIGKASQSTEADVLEDRSRRTIWRNRSSAFRFGSERPIGAIAIYRLLQQKDGFSALDHELFTVLGGHAATALFAARLYSQSERKLNTIQGFIDLLTK